MAWFSRKAAKARREEEFNNTERDRIGKAVEHWQEWTARDDQSNIEPTSRFDHPQALFSLSYPQRWHRIEPVSKDASFACRAEDGAVLIEVFCFEHEPNELHLVDVIVDGLVKCAAFEEGMTRGCVIGHNSFSFGGAERCVDVRVCYRRETESDAEITVDYFVIGTGRHALQIAMKTITELFPSNLNAFDRLLGTLRTPWMHATERPNLSGGGRPRR